MYVTVNEVHVMNDIFSLISERWVDFDPERGISTFEEEISKISPRSMCPHNV